MHKAQSKINHVVINLDASYSMQGRQRSVIAAVDDQIKYLRDESIRLNQETRISVYHFGEHTIECLLFDMDVTRLPSANSLYKVLRENTALIDAVDKVTTDLHTTSQLYGDHGFLVWTFTDGQENRSKLNATHMRYLIQNSDDNWTYGFMVPDEAARKQLMDFGVLHDAVALWNMHSSTGLEQSFDQMRQATTNYMTSRAAGTYRGTKSIFSTGADAVNPASVKQALTPIPRTNYDILNVTRDIRIDDFVKAHGYQFHLGMGYYQLTKTENIQPQKQVIVVDKTNGQAYSGANARALLGLGNDTVRVKPDYNPKYDVFVQSTAPNRKLLAGTKLLIR